MAFIGECGSGVTMASEGYGMGLSRSTSFGRKRVFLSSHTMEFGEDYDYRSSLKRRCCQDSVIRGEKSALEELPQDLLLRILCGVEHDDLKRLFFVSKAIRDASLIAKQSHFAYSTPKKTVGFQIQNAECFGELFEAEAPNAPKQSRVPRRRLSVKKLADISVALFASGNEHSWPRGDLFSEK